MVGDAGDTAVQFGPAQFLGGDDLAGGGAHQRRTAEKDRALAFDDDRFVGHRRDIGAARRARAHDESDLRHAQRRQPRLVVKDAAEMVAVGKDLVLRRQIGATRIDEIKAGQPVLAGDLLRAQMLFDGDREIGAALDRGVIGDDDAFPAHDPADPGDDAGGGHLAVIHAVRGEGREFEKGRARIEQQPHPLAHRQLAARQMPPPRLGAAPLLDLCHGFVADRRPARALLRHCRGRRPSGGRARSGGQPCSGSSYSRGSRRKTPSRGRGLYLRAQRYQTMTANMVRTIEASVAENTAV